MDGRETDEAPDWAGDLGAGGGGQRAIATRPPPPPSLPLLPCEGGKVREGGGSMSQMEERERWVMEGGREAWMESRMATATGQSQKE